MKNTDKARFMKALSVSSISDLDSNLLKSALDYFEKESNPLLSTRIFLFLGEPGVGKTYLAERMFQAIGARKVYCGTANMENAVICSSIEDVSKEISKKGEAVILVDDIAYKFEQTEIGISSADQETFMKILDSLKGDSSKMLIMTLNNMSDFDLQMMDRVEAIIKFDVPSEKAKVSFLRDIYGKILDSTSISFLSRNSFGYSFRDISTVIKRAYQIGKGNLWADSLSKAVKGYTPGKMRGLEIENSVKLNFSDIIGKKDAMFAAKRLILSRKNPKTAEKLGLSISSRLLFYGPPGTGKTFTAKAIAGELGYPLIKINCRNIDPLQIFELVSLSRRYRECVIFLDEADKIFGGSRYGEDSSAIGFLNAFIDGNDTNAVRSVLILAVNEPERFGAAFRDRFTEVCFGFPEKQERFEYFQKKATKAGISADFGALSEKTEGMTFRDMERVWAELMFQHVEKGRIDEDSAVRAFQGEGSDNKMFG